jgi:hypothetical protein
MTLMGFTLFQASPVTSRQTWRRPIFAQGNMSINLRISISAS